MKTETSFPILLQLMRYGALVYSTKIQDSIEVGRRQAFEQPEPSIQEGSDGKKRFVVAALELRGFPRQLLRLDPEPNFRVRVSNLHPQAVIKVSNGPSINASQQSTFPLPVTLILPEGFVLEVQRDPNVLRRKDEEAPSPAAVSDDFTFLLNSLSLPPSSVDAIDSNFGSSSSMSRNHSLTRMAIEPSGFGHEQIGTVLTWLEQALAAMQRPASSTEFYAGIAEAVTRIIEVDRSEIILWDGQQWQRDSERVFIHPDIPRHQSLQDPSISLLNEARTTRRITIHPRSRLFDRGEMADSVRQLHAAVACPILDIFGGGEDILGVLYADRQTGSSTFASEVMETEQKLIAILATAIASSIARANREKLVTKYQQFFSPKVTEAIRQNPMLLEGEDADVTVLFCDIRGFSRETDRIGSAAAMRWVSETLSELSERVLQTDGVLVDYVGDEMFAMWGAPEKSEDHAQRAVKAAVEMMHLRQTLSKKFSETIPNGVDFGIGICTGPARVGNTGSRQKFKYGPLGRTVNLGSRLQGLTKQWKVCCVLDKATEALLPEMYLRRRLCEAQVIGMEGSTSLFELMDEDSDRNRELVAMYGRALDLFESGTEPRLAARAFGELVQLFPEDGPSLLMLVRAVNELVKPTVPFSSLWVAATK